MSSAEVMVGEERPHRLAARGDYWRGESLPYEAAVNAEMDREG